ncbi:hypothetical protein C2869_18260 [Saccharobesus litoralis]|uniref:Uncharacterized protein n=1 Tax=Saccharobesus litoralis TaxID=2172099 RepID=A0A2S0VVJ1_9ALTE|nr:hypothetical protein [Saccharobesus litoralis]AWB68236.1 hypothetical protein C2869_18260 [Saccharobesus litoralis]
MSQFKTSTLIATLACALMTGCSSTADTQANKQTVNKQQKQQAKNKADNKKKQVAKKQQNNKKAKNLLAYANPGFEQAIDPKILITRKDKGQENKAEFGLMKEAAKSGKQGLAISLEAGSMKLQYGIWRLRNQIDPSKKYRFAIDANLVKGHAVMFNQAAGSHWKRAEIKNQDGWQVVSTVIEGEHLKKGKPLAFHIDTIKGKEPGVVLVDNVRLFEIQ